MNFSLSSIDRQQNSEKAARVAKPSRNLVKLWIGYIFGVILAFYWNTDRSCLRSLQDPLKETIITSIAESNVNPLPAGVYLVFFDWADQIWKEQKG